MSAPRARQSNAPAGPQSPDGEGALRALLEASMDGVVSIDARGRIVEFNPAAERLFGWTRDEALGRDMGELLVPEDLRAAHRRALDGLRAGGEGQRVEMPALRRDGSRFDAELCIARIAGGGSPAFTSTVRDVGERKRDDALLRLEHQITLSFTEALSAPDALRAAMRAICETQGWEAARYLYVDDVAQVLRAGESWSIDAPGVRRYLEESRSLTYAPGAGLVGTVWRSGEPLWVPDITQDARVARPGLASVTGLRGSMVFPVHAGGGTIGVLIFDSREPRRPDERLLRALRVIGGQIGLLVRRAQAEDALRESEARFRSLSQLSSDWFWETDTEHRFISPPGRIMELTGFDAGHYLGRRRWEIGELTPLEGDWNAHIVVLERRESFRDLELTHRTRDGDRRYLQISGEPVWGAAGAFKGYRGTAKDISARKRYESHIEHLANHDSLTGLPNRTRLRDRVGQAIVHAKRTSSSVALLYVDLDQFKLVNDSWGHLVGDALLLEVGTRLKAAMREGDTVARLGGDEFVILLSDLARPGDSALVARKIAGALARPVELEGRVLQVTASIGIAIWPGDGTDLDSLLQCADAAMYRAKDAGRDGFQYYSTEMGTQTRARVELEAGLRRALELGELRLHWQPQVGLAGGEVRGAEALLRWERPAKGLVSPAQFIPVAEDSGLIVPIGDWALRSACREAAAWADAGLGRIKVAVNLSARQFWQNSVVESVGAALAESALPAECLELEITESVVARDLDQVTKSLEQLRSMGVSIAIDDFGTGYSSLSYLRSLPIQKVKIDRSFIQGIAGDTEGAALVRAIIDLAHVLSLEVVAEGVETHGQAAFLRQAGCEAMQGYLFSRPVPPADFAALLRSGRRFAAEER